MAELFLRAVLGHLVGDYLLQSKAMALGKTKPGARGLALCTLHVALYTAAVCAFLGTLSPVAWAAVFVPHWLIDRFSLALHWLRLIGGRTFEAAHRSTDEYRDFDVAFTAVVYTVADATLHLLCLWAVVRWVPL